MANDVSICNLALAHLVQTPNIVSIDPPDGGAYAKSARQFFSTAINQCLSECDWDFARKRKVLTAVDLGDNQPSSWEYAFQLPGDIVKERRLIETGDVDTNPIDYYIEGEYLYANAEDVTLCYTKKLTDLTRISIGFELSASMLMASYLCGSVTPGNMKLKQYWMEAFNAQISRAAADILNKGLLDWDHVPVTISDR